ncbi:MAG: hypothetical protein LIP11_03305 [Clostridiales bacterium]|nr:hypothetical protein [Clostridiales bacterium]
MRNKKRFAALALATVLAVSQVTAVAPVSSVVAEETEEESEYESDEDSETEDASDSSDTDADEESSEESEEEDLSESDETEDESATEEDTPEDESEADTEEKLNVGITLAGLDGDGTSVANEDGDEEESDEEESNEEDEESESWWIDVDWQNNTNCLLVGETVSEIVYLQHYYYYEEDEDGWWTMETVPVSEYSYTLNYDTGSLAISTDTTEDGYGLILNAEGLEEGDATLVIRFYDADGDLIAKDYLYFYVSDSGYYYLSAEYSDGIVVPLGENYDLTESEFTLYLVSDSGEGAEVSAVDEDMYYLSVDSWEDYCFESLDGTTLANRIHTDGTYAYVAAYRSDDGEWLAGTSIWFDGLDYDSIELSLTDENLNEYGYYIVYDYDQGVELSYTGEYELPDGYTVEWGVYEEHRDIISVSGDSDSATVTLLTDDTDYDGWWVCVYADIYYADNWIAGSDIWMEVVISYTEYYTFGDTTVALGEGLWYDASIDCYVRSYDYPYGENTSVQLMDLTAVSQYEYTDDGEQLTDDVISLDGDSESGWGIGTNTYGYAIMQGTYTDLDGEEQTFEFIIYVDGEYYYLNYAYLEETDGRVQVDGTITIDTSLQCVYTNDDGDAESYTIEDYLDEGFSLNYSDYDGDIISVEITNDGEGGPDRMLAVTGLSEGGTDLYIYVTNEDGDVVADAWLWIEVTEDYYVLTYESATLPLGATVDMGNLESNEYVTYTLTHYYTDDEGENASETIDLNDENSYIEIENYDDGCLERVEEEGTQLTRTNTWETWADVHVMLYNEDSDEYEEVASCGVVFGELTYDVSLTNDSLDGNWVIYAGIDMTVSYELSEDSESLPEDAEYIWAVQYWDDDEQDMLDVYEELATWTENEDGTITISTYSDERDIRVSLQVMYNDNEIIWAEEWISTRSEGSYINIWVEDGSLLFGEYTYVYGTYGDDSTELTFSDVYVVSYDSWDDYDAEEASEEYTLATVSQDEEGNWVITANTDGDSGVVQVIVTYYDPYEEEYGSAEAGTIWVGGDRVVYEYPNGQDFEINRPEGDNTIEIPVNVYYEYAEQNEDGEWETYREESDIYGLVYYDEYEDSVIEVSYSYEGNSLVFTVTGLEEGWTNFSFSTVDEEGGEPGYEWISISVNGKLDASIDTEEYTVDKEYGDEDFNLVEELDMEIVSDSDVYYTILEGDDVVEIDEDGNITIIGVGTATIKVYVEETNTYSYAKVNITINVDKAEAAITGTASYTVTYGTTTQFYLEDIEATGDGTISYEVTSGTAVLSVDSDGLVKVLSTGTAEITVSTSETVLYNAATFTITVTVNEAETESETTATESETTAAETESETETLYIIEAATDDEYTIGKDTSAVIKCNGELSEFISVAVDGVIVDASNYTLTEGSTILTFTQDYMDSLSVGVHTVTLTYTGGRTVSALLTVKELTSDSDDQTESETTATESETTATEIETETETTATESETETETIATESETESETAATESETETEAQTETNASGSETDPTETETDVNGSETDGSGTETESETTETESETTAAESETTATETTATESETDSTVATGDDSPIEVYVAVMLLAMSILLAGTLYRRMNRNTR